MVVWNDFKDAGSVVQKSKAGYAFSTDGGNSWPIVNVIPEHNIGGINYLWGFDPSSAFDRLGNAYYCYVTRKTDFTGDDRTGPVHLSKTSDNGANWTHAGVSLNSDEQDKPFMAIDNSGGTYNGRVYIITVAWKERKGRYRISSIPTIAVDQNTGYIYVAYTQLDAGGNLNVYFVRSTNNGQSFGTPFIATDPAYNSFAQFFPWLSLDPTGRVGLAFCDDRNDPSPPDGIPLIDIYYAESINNGISFSTPNLRITDTNPDASYGTFTTDYQGLASTVGLHFPAWNDFRNNNTEDVYFARVNRAPASNSSMAIAGNGLRKIARESNGNYHLVLETNGEIWYARKTTSDTEWNNYQRLSTGVGGGNSSSCIAERGGKLYVVWQRYDGSKYDVHFRKSTDGGGSWGSVSEIFSNFTPNSPLPVITSPNTSKLTVVCRGSSSLQYKASTNDGSSWTSGGISLTGADHNYPTLAPTTTYWGSDRSALVYASTASVINYRYYRNGPDSTGWNSPPKNLSQIVPGTKGNI